MLFFFFFFTKLDQMSRVGSRSQHPKCRPKTLILLFHWFVRKQFLKEMCLPYNIESQQRILELWKYSRNLISDEGPRNTEANFNNTLLQSIHLVFYLTSRREVLWL